MSNYELSHDKYNFFINQGRLVVVVIYDTFLPQNKEETTKFSASLTSISKRVYDSMYIKNNEYDLQNISMIFPLKTRFMVNALNEPLSKFDDILLKSTT